MRRARGRRSRKIEVVSPELQGPNRDHFRPQRAKLNDARASEKLVRSGVLTQQQLDELKSEFTRSTKKKKK